MKPLIKTNPYLKNKEHREIANVRSARTSCGVEGIKVRSVSNGVQIKIDSSKTKEVFNKMKQRLNRS